MTVAASPRFAQRWMFACDGPVSALALAPNGNRIAAATEDGAIVVADARSGSIVWRARGHEGGTPTLDWTPDSTRLLSGGRDGHVAMHDDQGTHLIDTACGTAWVERVAVAPHGRTFAVACGRDVSLYEIGGTLIGTWPSRASTVLDLAWKPAGRTRPVACVAYGAVALLREHDLAGARQLRWPGSSLALVWSPDGKFIATGDQDATVHLWTVQNATDFVMSGYERKVRELAWSEDARYLATGGGSTITVWDCAPPGPAGSEPIVLQHHAAPLRALAFRGRDALLASAASDGSLAVSRLATRRVVAAFDGDGSAVTALCWTHDDGLVVSDADGYVTAWSRA